MLVAYFLRSGYLMVAKKEFSIPLQNRDATTLIPIKREWILPGTIWSDMWVAYSGLQGPFYQHSTVNHTHDFVDLQTGVTTKNKDMWCRAKGRFKSIMSSTNREMITDY